jgi:predicted Zn-dependent protease
MMFEEEDINKHLVKWQDILRLRDWDIKYEIVNNEWRKTGDIKIDSDDRKAILLINNYNPKQTNLEALIIHELLHLKLWGMDQMIEGFIYSVFGQDESDPKFNFAYTQFMTLLETTVEDLSKSFVKLGAEDKEISFGRVKKQVDKELGRKD